MELTPAETTLEQAAEIFAALGRGEVWNGEFLVRRKDGTAFHAMVGASLSLAFKTSHNIVGTALRGGRPLTAAPSWETCGLPLRPLTGALA